MQRAQGRQPEFGHGLLDHVDTTREGHSALHLGKWRGPYQTTGEFIEATWLPLVRLYEHEINTEHPALAAYLLGQGLRSVIRSVLDDMPAQMESAAFLDSLVGMAMGCLQPATFD